MILTIANILVKKETGGITTEKVLELWIKHLKPVWKQDMLKDETSSNKLL